MTHSFRKFFEVQLKLESLTMLGLLPPLKESNEGVDMSWIDEVLPDNEEFDYEAAYAYINENIIKAEKNKKKHEQQVQSLRSAVIKSFSTKPDPDLSERKVTTFKSPIYFAYTKLAEK